jgi:hypothetical protein
MARCSGGIQPKISRTTRTWMFIPHSTLIKFMLSLFSLRHLCYMCNAANNSFTLRVFTLLFPCFGYFVSDL